MQPSFPITPEAFLIDLDGVIYVQEKLVPGAFEAIRLLRDKGIPHCFVTNTTTYNRTQIVGKLERVGVTIPAHHLFTAPAAAAQYLQSLRQARCFFYVHPNLMEEFEGISSDESDPTHVVIGDVGEHFTYQAMNGVFRMIMQGAEMIALQKNRFWLTSEGMKLDAGAFIAALEYATGKIAHVFGKPSIQFFRQACGSLGSEPGKIVMIGDDLRADIQGAKEAGLQTIFVRTGKDKDTSLERIAVRPDVVLNSIAELPGLL